MTLYEINREIGLAIEALFSSVDEETGEVNQEAAEALDQLKEARDVKLDNIGAFMKNLNAEADAIASEINALKERLDRKKKEYDRLKRYVENCMQFDGQTVFESARVRFSFRKSTAVEIKDENLLPKKFLVKEIKFKPDKTAIKEALNNGQKVRGAEVVTRNNLQIK